jgi:hypothetical protein
MLGGIHGSVRAAHDGQPLAGVRVEVDGAVRTSTDSAGRYSIGGLPTGSQEIRFTAPGYDVRRLTVFLADSTDFELDVELTARPVVLPGIVVLAPAAGEPDVVGPFAIDSGPEAGHYRFGRDWKNGLLPGDVDVQRALTEVPGIGLRGDNSSAISVHGGGSSDNLILLDGIPVFGATHFAGALSAINPDAIARIDVHTGVSSTRFGDHLAGVVELETAELGPDSVRLSGATGPADVRSVLRGPLGHDGGFLIGGRTSFRNLLGDGAGSAGENGYRDFLGVAQLHLGAGTLRLVSFHSTDRLRLEPGPGSSGGSDEDGLTGSPGVAATADRLGWRSTSAGVTWTQGEPAGRQLHLSGWWAGMDGDIRWLDSIGVQQLHGNLSELGASAEVVQPYRSGSFLLGASAERPATTYLVSSGLVATPGAAPLLGLATSPALGSVFAEWTWRASSVFAARAGVRGNTDFRATWNLEPRISLSVHPSGATRFDLGIGRTHQTVQSLLNEENLLGTIVGFGLPIASAGNLPTASADQIELGVQHRVAPGLALSLDGYVRRWRGVPLPAASTQGLFVADSIVNGRGNAQGVEAGVALDQGPFALRTSVGLARTVQWAGTEEYHAGVERPWSFSTNLYYRLARRTTAQIALSGGAGQPSSIVSPGLEWEPYRPLGGSGEIGGSANSLAGAINPVRLPGYFRLDLGLRRGWPLGLAGHRGLVSTALGVDNLLDRANPVGIGQAPDGALRTLRGTPRSAIIEVGWTF